MVMVMIAPVMKKLRRALLDGAIVFLTLLSRIILLQNAILGFVLGFHLIVAESREVACFCRSIPPSACGGKSVARVVASLPRGETQKILVFDMSRRPF